MHFDIHPSIGHKVGTHPLNEIISSTLQILVSVWQQKQNMVIEMFV